MKKILLVSTILMNLIYIGWRIFFTIPKGEGYISLFFALGLLLAEIMGVFELLVHIHGVKSAMIPQLPKIDEELFPLVDVFIATYNEPIDLVRKTVIGCKHMQYPDRRKVNIVVCDDGDRAEMKNMAKQLGVNYLSRNNNKGAKAGNLNHALKHTDAPFIATFDADMIPRHNFLMETIPYFLVKEQRKREGNSRYRKEDRDLLKVGFIQTPQSFYNTDLFQFNLYSERRIPNEQDYFYKDIQTTKNTTNTVIYGGSNTVILRKALEDVGGFYENSITEDFATGILIQSKGYRCFATEKVLASGLSPSDLKSLLKQRERWARGCIQTIRRVNILFLKGLTITQKISYFASISYWYASIKRFFYILAPIMYAVIGIKVVHCSLIEILLFFVPMYLLTNLTIKSISGNIRNSRWTNIYETIVFHSLIGSIILETLGITKKKFSVTNKDKVVDEDKSYRRARLLPFYIYIVLSLIGIMNVLIYLPSYQNATFLVVLFWLCSNLLYLIMAFFFVWGRKEAQKIVYYQAEVDYIIKNKNLIYSGKTKHIEEDGFVFQLQDGVSLEQDEILDVHFFMHTEKEGIASVVIPKSVSNSKKSDRLKNKIFQPELCLFESKLPDFGEAMDISVYGQKYEVSLCGRIESVRENEEVKEYLCKILDMNEEERDLWNLILHDRIPTMPKTIKQSKNIYQDLMVNIRGRLKNKSA